MHGMECLAGAVINLKQKYSSPFFIVSGDFNQWNVGNYLDEFSDFTEVDVDSTRNDKN